MPSLLDLPQELRDAVLGYVALERRPHPLDFSGASCKEMPSIFQPSDQPHLGIRIPQERYGWAWKAVRQTSKQLRYDMDEVIKQTVKAHKERSEPQHLEVVYIDRYCMWPVWTTPMLRQGRDFGTIQIDLRIINLADADTRRWCEVNFKESFRRRGTVDVIYMLLASFLINGPGFESQSYRRRETKYTAKRIILNTCRQLESIGDLGLTPTACPQLFQGPRNSSDFRGPRPCFFSIHGPNVIDWMSPPHECLTTLMNIRMETMFCFLFVKNTFAKNFFEGVGTLEFAAGGETFKTFNFTDRISFLGSHLRPQALATGEVLDSEVYYGFEQWLQTTNQRRKRQDMGDMAQFESD